MIKINAIKTKKVTEIIIYLPIVIKYILQSDNQRCAQLRPTAV